MNGICRIISNLTVAVLLLSATDGMAGHPLPYEHPAEFRQANMVMLKFQDALAGERWQDALALCSDRVRAAALQWPSAKEFVTKTTPLEKVLANCRFGFYREQHNKAFHSYGLLIQLTEPRQEPLVQWYWSIFTTNNTWAIDWEPVAIDLSAMIEKKRTEILDHQKRVDAARRELDPKLRAIKTHLTALSDRYVVGAPMLFRVELMNFGTSPVDFTAAGVGYYPLRILNERGDPIPCTKGGAQIGVQRGKVAPGSSEILADKIDITKDYGLSSPGTYFVQFDGVSLDIGERIPSTDNRFFDDSEFVATPTKFPSNVVKIEVRTGQKE